MILELNISKIITVVCQTLEPPKIISIPAKIKANNNFNYKIIRFNNIRIKILQLILHKWFNN